jgi:excisionase family DNA binding protein
MDKDQSEIMTIAEVAEYLKIPTSSVYKLAQEGKIPSQKVGRHWRFHRPTLINWVSRGFDFVQSKPSDKLDFS